MYIKYDIQATDTFDAASYGHVTAELTTLALGTAGIKSENKSAIIISFLKDHSIRMDWLKGDSKLAKAITSRTYKTPHVEALFDGCRNNVRFLYDFESYIRTMLQKR